jgi:alkanesulfonate monooxygenase SsuD/methylene tetrahydromethanopterin reductase-like flavin-dependent oxidoreductase (luciferase family)
MKVGMLLNVNNHTVGPASLARAAEAAGFESLWVGDHPVICILPVRHPIMTALQGATLDCFSNGRLLFGVGCGWLREELELLGADHARRLEQTREHIEAIRALSDPVRPFEGEWVTFAEVKLNPRPAQPGGPRIHLGTWRPTAVRRVAEWADGWLPMLVMPEQLAADLEQLRAECERRGRDPEEFEVTLFEYDPRGDRDALQELLGRYADPGADRVGRIQGLGDHMGSHEWETWSADRFGAGVADVAGRYLTGRHQVAA